MNPFSVFSFLFRWLDGRTVAAPNPAVGVSDTGDPVDGGEVVVEAVAEAASAAFDVF